MIFKKRYLITFIFKKNNKIFVWNKSVIMRLNLKNVQIFMEKIKKEFELEQEIVILNIIKL